MGVGGGSGGGGFKLEKTWRSTGVGTQTFNSPGNFTFPYGKYSIDISGRAQPGNFTVPGNISSYNPRVPGNISGYNPQFPSNIAGYNTIVPGNATGVYNSPTGGNLAGYNQVGGNLAGYNPANPPTTQYAVSATEYIVAVGRPAQAGTATGNYNPPSGGNATGSYNSPSGGNATGVYNPPSGGNATGVYNAPSGGNLAGYQQVGGNIANYNAAIPASSGVNVYAYIYQTYSGFYQPGNFSGYNPPSGNVPGTAIYNSPYYKAPEPGGLDGVVFDDGSQPSCPAPYSYYDSGFNPSLGYFYETVNYTCSPYTIPATPSTANYNPISYNAVYNPVIPSSQNYNPIITGNQNYNPVIVGSQNYNPIISGSAVYNSPIPAGGNLVTTAGPTYLGVFNSVPSPYTYTGYQYVVLDTGGSAYVFRADFNIYVSYTSNSSTTPGNPGNALYNSISYQAFFNPTVPGTQNYNSPTGGTPNYNAAINSTANYNSPTGQNAVYNSPIPGTSGNAMTVLGVYFPGGLPNQPLAPLVTSTINTYTFPDASTQPISLAPGGFVNITVK